MFWVVQWEILEQQAGAAADKGKHWPLVVGGEGAADLRANRVQRKYEEKRSRCDSGNNLMDSPCFHFLKNDLGFVPLCLCCVESMKRPPCDCLLRIQRHFTASNVMIQVWHDKEAKSVTQRYLRELICVSDINIQRRLKEDAHRRTITLMTTSFTDTFSPPKP